MAKKKTRGTWSKMVDYGLHRIAHYTFFAGIVIAIIMGNWHQLFIHGACVGGNLIDPVILVTTLAILGFIVGLFNLTTKETKPFLIAATALILAGIVNLALIPKVGFCIRSSLSNIVVFVVPGAIIVGMKAVWKLASD